MKKFVLYITGLLILYLFFTFVAFRSSITKMVANSASSGTAELINWEDPQLKESLSTFLQDSLVDEIIARGIQGKQGPVGPTGLQGPSGEDGAAEFQVQTVIQVYKGLSDYQVFPEYRVQ